MEKYRVIIVDDEMLIRKLIRMKLDTEGLQLDIVGEFSDVESAMKQLDSLQPHIVLSDICMLGEDGITFAAKCVDKYPQIKVIIITGYNDFDYARRSLKAGVYDYLMKPVQGEELNDTVRRACEEILKEREKEENERQLLEQVKSNLPALKQIYLNRIMLMDEPSPNLEEKLRQYGIRCNESASKALVICMIMIRESIERPDLVVTFQKHLEEFFCSEEYVHVIEDSWGRIVVISNSRDFPLEQCMDMLHPRLQEKYDCHIVRGFSTVFSGWEELREAYKNVLSSIQERHGNRTYDVTCEEGLKCWNGMYQMIDEGKYDAARIQAEHIIDKMGSQLSKEVLDLFMQQLYAAGNLKNDDLTCAVYLKNCRTKQELNWWMSCFLTEYIALKIENEPNGAIIKDVICYMNQHIDNPDMNLNYMANLFNMSNGHLSRLIKQYTAKNYVELLSDARMMRMIYMLNNMKLKDKDIGMRIGIQDAHYLSIWFKKVTGSSVSSYRKQIEKTKK